jgi:hypothetical protein
MICIPARGFSSVGKNLADGMPKDLLLPPRRFENYHVFCESEEILACWTSMGKDPNWDGHSPPGHGVGY